MNIETNMNTNTINKYRNYLNRKYLKYLNTNMNSVYNCNIGNAQKLVVDHIRLAHEIA